jgi:hypothetical protein
MINYQLIRILTYLIRSRDTLVYKLLKLDLLLPIATVSVEWVFLTMNLIKTDIRNNMGDKWMNDYLITFIEKKIFNTMDNERIMQKFQNMKSRREKISSLT